MEKVNYIFNSKEKSVTQEVQRKLETLKEIIKLQIEYNQLLQTDFDYSNHLRADINNDA